MKNRFKYLIILLTIFCGFCQESIAQVGAAPNEVTAKIMTATIDLQ